MSKELSEFRTQLAAARIRVRHLETEHRIVKARAETRVIEAAGSDKALGANAEARERALLLALERDADYTRARDALSVTMDAVDALESHMSCLLDERRERELAARERLIDVLAAAYGIVLSVGGDEADAVADAEAVELALGALPGRPAEDDSRDCDDWPLSEAEATREWAEHDARTEIDAAEDAADAAALANGMPTRESLPF